MTNFEKYIEKSAEGYSLSSDERAKMSRVIREYMAHKPLPHTQVSSISISYSWFSIIHRPIAAALVLVLVFGSGVSYAAENTLPGDILYGVKTSINEPLRVALATNAEAKAEVQIELAERRIEEAATLSSEGRLDNSTQDELATAFESHAAAASENIEKAGEEDSSAQVELASRFETRLVAHESVLAEVEMESEDSNDDSHSHRLSDAIHATNEILAEARFDRSNVAIAESANLALDIATSEGAAEPMMMTMSLATDAPAEATDTTRSAKFAAAPEPAPAPDAKTISRMESAAEKSLKNAQKTLRNAKSLSAEAKARADGDIKLAGDLLDEGNDALENDADADAFASFEESLRVSEQAVVYIKAAPALEKARSRNSSRRGNNSGSVKGIEVNVSVPAATINATVTVSTTSQSNGTDDGANHDVNDDRGDDGPDHDQNDDHGGNGGDDESGDDNGGSFNLLNKLNLSL